MPAAARSAKFSGPVLFIIGQVAGIAAEQNDQFHARIAEAMAVVA